MGIPVLTTLPDGRRAEIDSDVLGVAQRLEHGDPTLGWSGDRGLCLVFNQDTAEFEVWHNDLHGEPYMVACHHRCDGELIRKVVAADNRNGNVFDRIRAQNAEVDRERRRRFVDWHENHWVPKARWALTRDVGHLNGGSRPTTSFHIPEAK